MLSRAVTPSLRALRDLRKARRRNRLADIHWADSIYRVYVLALCVGGAVWWAASTLGNRQLAGADLARFARWLPVAAATIIAAVVWGGARSGLRGGPLAIEGADLAHVLNSPIPRTAALRSIVVQQLRRGLFLGCVGGAIVGRLVSPFAPGGPVRWSLTGGLFGAVCGLMWMAGAMNVSGRNLRPRLVKLFVCLLTMTTLANYWHRSWPTPLVALSKFTLLPFESRARSGLPAPAALWAIVASLLALGAAAAAIAGSAGLDIDRAQRRAALVGQLRFAVTTQDLRAVMLLRRQLGAEEPRLKPWFRVPSGHGVEAAVLARTARSLARWPARRFGRVVGLAVASGLAARAAWQGALPLLIVPGLCGLLAGLDAVEVLSQDADHLSLLAGLPRHRGRLANRQIIVPLLLLVGTGALGAVAGWLCAALFSAPLGSPGLGVCLALGVTWALAATMAAALSVALGPPPFLLMLQTPELGFARMAILPALSILGTAAPIGLARLALSHHDPMGQAVFRGFLLVVACSYGALNVLTSAGIRDPK